MEAFFFCDFNGTIISGHDSDMDLGTKAIQIDNVLYYAGEKLK